MPLLNFQHSGLLVRLHALVIWHILFLVWLIFKPRILGECIFHHLILTIRKFRFATKPAGIDLFPGDHPA